MSKKIMKLLLMVFVIGGIFCVENKVVQAETSTYTDASKDFISVKMAIPAEGMIPKASGDYEDWLFAGWYSAETCTDESAMYTKTTGQEAYAKFVPADVLTVKCQVKSDIDSGNAASTNMRLVSSVDSLNYRKVGFKVIYNNSPEIDASTYTVYNRIVASAESGVTYNYSPKVVDTKSEYFVTATLTGINKSNYGNIFLIKPYWETCDGTVVYGPSRYVTVADSYTDVVNLPVKAANKAALEALKVSEETVQEYRYSDNGEGWGAIMLAEDKSALSSLTKYTFSDGQVAYWRNLETVYSENNADQTWYTAISDEAEYVIATSADLYGMATDVTKFAGKTIYLCADIEANKGTATADGWDTTQVDGATEYNWPTTFQKFDGTFDGQGHTIKGIYSKQELRAAFFQHIGSNGVVQNFKLQNSYMEGSEYNGSIAGRLDGVIKDIVSDAIVKGYSSTNGGIVGFAYAPTTGKAIIKDCSFTGSVQTGLTAEDLKNFAGGIVGALWQGNLEIENCEVTGQVGAVQYYAGGILGGLNNGDAVATIDIKDCQFTGIINNTKGHSGGIIGSAYENTDTINIINCSVGGEINAGDRTGGLIGQIGGGTVTIDKSSFAGNLKAPNNYYTGGLVGMVVGGTVTIQKSNLEETGKVSAKETSGGLVGYVMGGEVALSECDCAGEVTSTWSTGGLVSRVANGKANINKSYFTGKVDGSKIAGGLVAYAQSGEVIIKESLSEGTVSIVNGAVGYYAGGLVGQVDASTVDIKNTDCSGKVEAKETAGGLVGLVTNGNVTIDASDFAGEVSSNWCNGGLVSRVQKGTVEIKNSSFEETAKITKGNYCGGFIGRVESGTAIINGCHATSMTMPGSYSGGIVGYVGGGSLTMDNTYFNGTFSTKNNYSGGILGYSSNGTVKIDNCYYNGTYNTTHENAGGIVGYIVSGNVGIKNSRFQGTLQSASTTDNAYAGGLVGNVIDGTLDIDNSYADGTLSVTKHMAGGLLGNVAGGTVEVSSSFSAMNFEPSSYNQKGGLIGRVYKEGTSMNVTLTDCLNSGTVQGYQGVGGLIGGFYKGSDGAGTLTITRCLNSGVVSATQRVGTIVGWAWNTPTVTDVYATNTSTASATGANAYDNYAYGTVASDTTDVIKYDLAQITVGNGVTADSIKSKLSGLFTAQNTVWTIGTTQGSTPKLIMTTATE